MTHSEAVGTNPALEPTDCTGELAELTSYRDRTHEGGQLVERTVEVFRCEACHWRVSMAVGRALNHYAMLPPSELTRSLAQQLGMPTGPGVKE